MKKRKSDSCVRDVCVSFFFKSGTTIEEAIRESVKQRREIKPKVLYMNFNDLKFCIKKGINVVQYAEYVRLALEKFNAGDIVY